MIASNLNDRYLQRNPSRRINGVVIVLLVHALIGYALIYGTARQSLQFIKKPQASVVIQEVTIAPPPAKPPPPPPAQKVLRPVQPQVAEVPAQPRFMPMPDAPVALGTVASLAALPAEPAAPVPTASPSPSPAPAAAVAKPSRNDMDVACPIQVSPEMPPRALREGAQGVVRAKALIRDGAVKEVTIVSGPPVFHAAVKAAMLQYKCTHDAQEVTVFQQFNFKFE